ncbi:MAG: LysM peptidoglycan-binding domain-containing protein [candidate division Zixibacteria bacterium]|nr:LysM peptidoglycan-binding domain-containing protein [candidate division Zixibacteria bacterium]
MRTYKTYFRYAAELGSLFVFLTLLVGCSMSPKGTVLKKPQTDTSQGTEAEAETPDQADSSGYYFNLAEKRYSEGVRASLSYDWEAAESSFESALEVLYLMEVDETDSGKVDRFNRLLREIAYDYKNTLVYIGELVDDTSQSLFLEQFYDLHTFKNQDFSLSTDTEEVPELKELTRDEPVYDVPMEWNSKVQAQINYLTGANRRHFQEYLNRSGKYIDLMRRIVREEGLPEDIVFLPLIESGFNPKAYSWAHASGPWQFISSTGRKYGLNRNWWYDERRDFVKSTHAACAYLKYLYQMFGDWKLALASYNGGEGRVGRTIKKQRTSDFWKLRLRKQTIDYVPRYMAAVMIAKEPEKYGFSKNYDEPLKFDLVEIKHCLDLKEIARQLDVNVGVLRELNPELLRDVTPPDVTAYQLRIPSGASDRFWGSYEELSSKGTTLFARHRVRNGETLSHIADKYRTSVKALAELNRMSTRKRIYAGQYLTVPVTANSGNYSSGNVSSLSNASTHRVRRGETLGLIARKYNTSVNTLAGLNGFSPNRTLYIGQVLKLPTAENLERYSSAPKPRETYFLYRVKRNDNLTNLANRYGTSVNTIRSLNGFSRNRELYIGEYIKVPHSRYAKNAIDKLASDLVIHVVREGDTLWDIAQSYGTSWRNILSWNNISHPRQIRPGQELKIYTN